MMNSFCRDPENVVRPRIPLTTCIKNFARADVIDGFYSTALERKSVVRKYVHAPGMVSTSFSYGTEK